MHRGEEGLYDDEFLELLGKYRDAKADCSSDVNFEIFSARYLMHHGVYDGAAECAERAFRERPVHLELWRILAESYAKTGDWRNNILFQGYMKKFYDIPLNITLNEEHCQESLDLLSLATSNGKLAPFINSRMSYDSEKGIISKDSVMGGEYLPIPSHGEYKQFVGAYQREGVLNDKGNLLRLMQSDDKLRSHLGADFTLDIMYSLTADGEYLLEISDGEEYILPLAGTVSDQQVFFQNNEADDSIWLGLWTYSFFRVEETTRVYSKDKFIVGRPIKISKTVADKPKLVINIFVDALCGPIVMPKLKNCMPNTYNFFRQGVIFGNHFGIAEYTYPSFTCIETGKYPHHTGIFNQKDTHFLPTDYVTLAERLRDSGYYTYSPMGAADELFNDTLRGYDRLLVSPIMSPVYEGIERTLHHLDAMNDVHSFLRLHLMDVHPFQSHGAQFTMPVQAKLTLKDRLAGTEIPKPSVYFPNTKLYQEAFWQGLRNVDRSLKQLYDYLELNYKPEEYVISFYSDHGVPIFERNPYIVGENQTGAVLMIRGGKCPSAGIVEELTSAVDIYPILAHLIEFPVGENVDGNLPAIFGGKERECVYSNSIFPGQTYKLAIRTKEHVFYLESLEAVDEDGTVDFAGAKLRLCERGNEERDIVDEALMKYFSRLAWDFVKGFANNGEVFPDMRKARSEWYGK